MKRKVLMFQPIIAPYRIDMVNELAVRFDFKLCLLLANLKTQKFDIKSLYRERLVPQPQYLLDRKSIAGVDIPIQIFDVLKSFNPDVVLVWEFGIVAWLVSLYRMFNGRHYKIVSLVDDSYDMLVCKRGVSMLHRVSRRLLMPLLDQIVNVEPRAKNWYRIHYHKGMYLPIVSDDDIYRVRLAKLIPQSEEYVRNYNLQGKKVLLYVGRLVPEKNLSATIKAFKNAHVSDAIYLIIGDGPEKGTLQSIIGESKSILLLGRFEADALYAWYNVAQVFILPSIFEPFGAVTNEALLSGCYTLVSGKAGSSCLIQNNVNGNVFIPTHERELMLLLKKTFERVERLQLPLRVKPNKMTTQFKAHIDEFIQTLSEI